MSNLDTAETGSSVTLLNDWWVELLDCGSPLPGWFRQSVKMTGKTSSGNDTQGHSHQAGAQSVSEQVARLVAFLGRATVLAWHETNPWGILMILCNITAHTKPVIFMGQLGIIGQFCF